MTGPLPWAVGTGYAELPDLSLAADPDAVAALPADERKVKQRREKANRRPRRVLRMTRARRRAGVLLLIASAAYAVGLLAGWPWAAVVAGVLLGIALLCC